jgi:CubicO group peptidase (beta-lactamase class C family)
MIKNALRIFAVVSSLVLTQSCASPTLTKDQTKLYERFNETAASSEMPGYSVRVVSQDGSLFSTDSGVRAVTSREPVSSNDVWHIGSCTKQMTAFAIAQLIDENKISFGSRLRDILSDQKMKKEVGDIAIGELLSHRSGVSDVTEVENGKLWPVLFDQKIDTGKARKRLVAGILNSPLHAPPGTASEYSNAGYVLLGAVIEKLDKKTWEESVRTRVFEKLELKSCGFGAAGRSDAPKVTQPWGHALEQGKLAAVSPTEPGADNPAALGPAGTIHCSTDDIAKFYFEISRQARGESKQVARETGQAMLTLSPLPPFTFNSMGRKAREWAKGDALAMNGSNTMNFTSVLVAPEIQKVFVVSTNSGTERAEAGVMEMMKALTTEFADEKK